GGVVRLLHRPLDEGHVQLRPPHPGPRAAAAGPPRQAPVTRHGIIAATLGGLPARSLAALAVFTAVMAAAPFLASDFVISVGMLAGIAVAALAGTVIGALSFRFRVAGVYFALLTIAFAEFTRILFDHFDWVGSSSGLFLPVANRATSDLVNLRGAPTMFYYVL